MKFDKKAGLLLLSSSLLLAACGNEGEGNTTEADEDEVTTLTFFSADLTEDAPFDDPVAEKITEETGVKLEISHPVGGDEQAIPLMIAGRLPDMILQKVILEK